MFSSKINCPHCASEIPKRSASCPKCGAPLGSAASAAQVPVTTLAPAAKGNDYFETIAGMTGLRYYPGKGPFLAKEGAVIGEKEGYLVAIGANKTDRNGGVSVLVRFPKSEQAERIREAVEFSPELLSALSISELSPKYRKEFVISDEGIHWMWPNVLKKQKPENVVRLLNAFLKAVKRIVPPFDGKCGECRTNVVDTITLLNGAPGYYCPSCQEKIRNDVTHVAQQYEEAESNPGLGFLYGLGGAVAGGIAWGVFGFYLERIFALAAIGIGYLVAWLVHKGTGKITLAGQVAVGALTLGSVLLGDIIFFTLVIARQEEMEVTFDLLVNVVWNIFSLESESGNYTSLIFGGLGAYYAIRRFQKPVFRVEFEKLRG